MFQLVLRLHCSRHRCRREFRRETTCVPLLISGYIPLTKYVFRVPRESKFEETFVSHLTSQQGGTNFQKLSRTKFVNFNVSFSRVPQYLGLLFQGRRRIVCYFLNVNRSTVYLSMFVRVILFVTKHLLKPRVLRVYVRRLDATMLMTKRLDRPTEWY